MIKRISVEERLPEANPKTGGIDYLLCWEGRVSVPFVGWYDEINGEWIIAHSSANNDPRPVNFWAPLGDLINGKPKEKGQNSMESENDREIRVLEAQEKKLMRELGAVQHELTRKRVIKRDEDSVNFIRANKITANDVHLAQDLQGNLFYNLSELSEWLKEQKVLKRWVEWNGSIYHTTDVISGKIPIQATPGLYAHVPKEQEEGKE